MYERTSIVAPIVTEEKKKEKEMKQMAINGNIYET
jgi:hypothetical protein